MLERLLRYPFAVATGVLVILVAGLASTIFMPIEAALLERMGWRAALSVLAVVLGVITIPIHALLLRQGSAGAAATGTDGAPAPSLTLGQAGRISGITPAAISLLAVHLKKNRPRDDNAPSLKTA